MVRSIRSIGKMAGLSRRIRALSWFTCVVMLASCGGGGGSSNQQTTSGVDGGSVGTTVNGTVVMGAYSVGTLIAGSMLPVAGATVLVGDSTPVTTSASGTFTVSGVHAPYDVTIAIGSAKLAVVYQGLTRSDPTLFVPPPSAPPHKATVTGTISGGVADPQVGQIAFGSPDVHVGNWIARPSGNVGLSPSWYGTGTTTGSLHLLVWTPDASIKSQTAVSYSGYLNVDDVALNDNAQTNLNTLSLKPVEAKTIFGTVTVPAGYTHDNRSVKLIWSDHANMAMYDAYRGALEPSYSYRTPGNVGALVTIEAAATGSAGESLYGCTGGHAPDATGVDIALHAAPAPSVPVDGAMGVTTKTTFAWAPMDGGIELVEFAASPTPSAYPHYLVFARAANATIPDLASVGLPLPGGIAYTWQVVGYWPYASVDAAAGPNSLPNAYKFDCSSDFQVGVARKRSFTTAP